MKDHQWGFGKKMLRPRCTVAEIKHLMEKVEQQGKHWIWKGHLNTYGYPNLYWKGHYEYAHRVFFAIFRGQINEGDDIHHRCRVSACVNPFHTKRKKHSAHASHHNNGLEEEKIPFYL